MPTGTTKDHSGKLPTQLIDQPKAAKAVSMSPAKKALYLKTDSPPKLPNNDNNNKSLR